MVFGNASCSVPTDRALDTATNEAIDTHRRFPQLGLGFNLILCGVIEDYVVSYAGRALRLLGGRQGYNSDHWGPLD